MENLAMANYAVDPDILESYVPAGTELDFWNDRCYVSLVGFMFLNTRLRGIRIPYHVNFEEVNLRFYVKRREDGEWKRGVVFIKEIVPRPALSWVANTFYKENYETLAMDHSWEENDDLSVRYRWKKSGKWNQLSVKAAKSHQYPKTGSEAEFITEHYWGYARINDRSSNEYEVTHPTWRVHEVRQATIEVDFGLIYGKEFASLNDVRPLSVMLAEGSGITVEPGKVISVNKPDTV